MTSRPSRAKRTLCPASTNMSLNFVLKKTESSAINMFLASLVIICQLAVWPPEAARAGVMTPSISPPTSQARAGWGVISKNCRDRARMRLMGTVLRLRDLTFAGFFLNCGAACDNVIISHERRKSTPCYSFSAFCPRVSEAGVCGISLAAYLHFG